MFTQFFGNYLLSSKLISIEQLVEALELQKTTRVKLGVLAINAGYMTAAEVDKVHSMQIKVDKRIGDIAVELGFLTHSQVEELLSKQKTGYLLLGQALVDKGYITNAEFEGAINSYKKEHKIADEDFTNGQNEKISLVISDFYNFGEIKDANIYIEYISLLFKNIIRFIGDDFAPLKPLIIKEYKCDYFVCQNVEGLFNIHSVIEAKDQIFIQFASRYAGEQYTENDDYVKAAVGEFLNLHNGLFSVNMSNDKEMELELEPQIIDHNKTINTLGTAFLIPIYFPFGIVNLIISNNKPNIE